MKNGLPKELVEFIVLHIDSVELLDVLALLQSKLDEGLSIAELDMVIRSSKVSIEKRLETLLDLGLVTKIHNKPDQYKYNPVDEEMREIGNALVLAYQSRRVEITELIYAKPMKEIMSFSNAFKLRGQKKDG